MSRQRETKKPLSKKSKIYISVGIAVSILAGIGGYFALSNNEDEKPVTDVQNQVQDLVDLKADIYKGEIDTEKYTSLSNVEYELLEVTSINQNDVDNTLTMNILTKDALTSEQLTKLGEEAYKTIQEELGKDAFVSVVTINLFNTKEGFEETKKEDYSGIHADGLIQTYVATYQNDTSITILEYLDYKPDTDLDSMNTSLDFDVVEANVSEDGKKITSAVILKAETHEEAQDMIQSIGEMIKTSNNGVEHIDMNIYSSEVTYADYQFSYQYSSETPTLLIHKKEIK